MNDFRQEKLWLVAAIAAVAASGCAGDPPKPAANTKSIYASLATPAARVDANAARDMISIYRRNMGLPVLRLDPALQRAAQTQADRIAKQGRISAGVRKGLPGILGQQAVAYKTAVQNLSAGYHTLPEAFSGWRQSRPHNANMLLQNATRMGIATVYVPGSKYRVYWALILAD